MQLPRSTCRLALLAGLPIAISSHAAVSQWMNAAGGSAGVGTNWNTGVVPAAGDVLLFPLSNTYTVTFPAAVSGSAMLNAGRGVVTMSFAVPHTTSQFIVGNDGVSAATVVVSGFLDANGATNAIGIGNIAGTGSGTVTVTGASSRLRSTAGGDIFVGAEGTGTLLVSSGARVESADAVILGAASTGNGNVTVSGNASTLITTSGVSGDIEVGASGAGSITVHSQGLLSVGRDIDLGPSTGSSGTVTMTTSVSGGTATIGRNCNIARNANAGSGAGTGFFNQIAGSSTIIGTTSIGDPDGGAGTLAVLGGTYSTRHLFMEPSHSTLDFRDGILQISGGVFTPPPGNFAINPPAAGTLPTLRLRDGGSTSLSQVFLCQTANRAARVEVLGGSSFTTSGSVSLCTVGATNSNASVLVDGTGSQFLCGSTLTIANVGTGIVDVSGGAHAQSATFSAGALAGGTGTLNVSGTGSTFTGTSSFALGGTPSSAGGVGNLNLTSGGLVHLTGPATMYPGSTTLLDHATFDSSNTVALNGTLNINAGTLNATTMTVTSTAVISGNGRINAAINNASVFGAQITLNGSMDIGPATSGGFDWVGAINVGPHALSVRDLQTGNRSRLGDVTINGGSITGIVAGSSFALANGDSLTGTGTIENPLEVTSAPIVATGASGLTFNGLVSTSIDPNVSMTGTRVTFASNGGLTAAGTISALTINHGTITATGTLSLGDGSPGGVFTDGTLNVGIHHVILNDQNGLSLGNCTIGGGNIELVGIFAQRNLNTTLNGHLQGFGTLTTPFFSNSRGGQISPGNPGAEGTGALFFTGNFDSGDALNTPGTLNIDVRDSESIDQLIVSGSASVGGTLNVTLDRDFTPRPGSRFTFINAASVSGAFSTLNIPAGSLIVYNATNVQILFPCQADFNLDSVVDFFDYLDFVDAFSAGDPSADFNDDSGIDFFDYLDFVDAYSASC